MKKYFPILLPKAGELTALQHLSSNVKNDIAPIIQYLPEHRESLEAFLIKEWSFNNNLIFIDMFLSQDFGPAFRGGFIRLFNACRKAKCNVGLCIRPNADPRYIAFINNMTTIWSIDVTIIIPTEEMHNVATSTKTILASLNRTEADTRIVLDGNAIDKTNYKSIIAIINLCMSTLPNYNKWMNVIVASGSFPMNLTAINPSGRKHNLPRYEAIIWASVQANPKFNTKTKYADYGIKNPIYSNVSFPGTCSIKYTIASDFVIYRGELSKPHALGNGQYIAFSKMLVASTDYSGRIFSWGDEEIYQKSLRVPGASGSKPGNAGSWVQYGQNHHITLLHSIL